MGKENHKCLNGNSLQMIKSENFQQIHVEGYSIEKQKVIMGVPLILLSGLCVAGGLGVWIVLGAGSLLALITSINSNNPKVKFRTPISDSDLEIQKLYCRYPQGWTDQQLTDLLTVTGNDSLQTIK